MKRTEHLYREHEILQDRYAQDKLTAVLMSEMSRVTPKKAEFTSCSTFAEMATSFSTIRTT